MPGQLNPDACCPECGVPLVALVDTETPDRIVRKYFHTKDPEAAPQARRPLPCRVVFAGPDAIDCAREIRRRIEV